jgi:hypothetical protein
MKLAPSGSYEKIHQIKLREGTAVAWISRGLVDNHWDKFLQESPLGQFQQSAIWSQTKNTEGWNPVRVVLTVDEELVGGFQMLWRSSWRGRIGYVSKGPVVLPGFPELAEFATDLLQQLTHSERLRGLVVQPPDLCKQMAANLAMRGFDFNMLVGVNEATCIVDLGDGFEGIEQRMSKWTRKKIRQALNRGIRIREGEKKDVKTFFELMLSTCRRQGVEPAPGDERTILALWDAAQPTQGIRLTFAEHEGKPLAGLVCILFGQTVSFWKKGWTSSDGRLHPNEPLMQEMLKWSSSRGYRFADFCALDKEMAVAMVSGEPLSPEQESSRHMFNVRLGGRPRLLPESKVYFPDPGIRLAYRVIYRKKMRQEEKVARLRNLLKTDRLDA